jgi:hypothetical protein
MESHWNYRRVKHINSKEPYAEQGYCTVHEIHWNADQTPHLFNFNDLKVFEKEDLERIAAAFDHPPVVEVDDASIFWDAEDDYGVWNYKTWKWLVEKDSSTVEQV